LPSKISNSITKAADVLKILSDGVDRISDISKRVQLSKSTTHRLLKSLKTSGLVMQDPLDRRYHLGPLILNLASRPIIAHQNLVVCAFEDMKYLRDLSGETTVLHIRIGIERICLEELQSFSSIRYTSGKGFIAPIYSGSAGKVLLSELEDDELHLILENIRFIPIAPNTITDKRMLLKELKKVKEQGYATSFSERVLGSGAISVPIKNYSCPVALSILGPDNRFSLDKMMGILEKLRDSASSISIKLKGAAEGRRGVK